jgi:3-hydroxyacyl-CoA dehydrogenase/enoyl-CoA hydratase/3-hydroxybutyryl-CoA epimerase
LTAHEIKLKNTLAGIIETHKELVKKEGQGFMIIQNEKKSIWKEWATIYPRKTAMMKRKWAKTAVAMVIDSYKCLDSGVIREPKDAGWILGLGFPVYTGE